MRIVCECLANIASDCAGRGRVRVTIIVRAAWSFPFPVAASSKPLPTSKMMSLLWPPSAREVAIIQLFNAYSLCGAGNRLQECNSNSR